VKERLERSNQQLENNIKGLQKDLQGETKAIIAKLETQIKQLQQERMIEIQKIQQELETKRVTAVEGKFQVDTCFQITFLCYDFLISHFQNRS
jgi:predicted RNase H-like nuclease (RuvC/YqgF family)